MRDASEADGAAAEILNPVPGEVCAPQGLSQKLREKGFYKEFLVIITIREAIAACLIEF